jgi:hypothetical protein
VRYQAVVEVVTTGSEDDLRTYVPRVADALYDLHDVIDPDMGGSFAKGTLDVSMILEADSLTDAVKRSLAAVRAAIHAAGGATPDWERYIDEAAAYAHPLA